MSSGVEYKTSLNFVYVPLNGVGGCISSALYRDYPTSILAAAACNRLFDACWIEKVAPTADSVPIWRVYSSGAVLNPTLVQASDQPNAGLGLCKLWRKSRYAYVGEVVYDLESVLASEVGKLIRIKEVGVANDPTTPFPIGGVVNTSVDASGVTKVKLTPMDVIPSRQQYGASSIWKIPECTNVPALYFAQPDSFYLTWPSLWQHSAAMTYSKYWTVPLSSASSTLPKASLVLWDTPAVDNFMPKECTQSTLISAHFLESSGADVALSSILPGKKTTVSGKWTIVTRIPKGIWEFAFFLPLSAVNVYMNDQLVCVKPIEDPGCTVPFELSDAQAKSDIVWVIDFATKPADLILPPSTSVVNGITVTEPGFEFSIAPIVTAVNSTQRALVAAGTPPSLMETESVSMLSSYAIGGWMNPVGAAVYKMRASVLSNTFARCDKYMPTASMPVTSADTANLEATLQSSSLLGLDNTSTGELTASDVATCVANGRIEYSDSLKAEVGHLFSSLRIDSPESELPRRLVGLLAVDVWVTLPMDVRDFITKGVVAHVSECLASCPTASQPASQLIDKSASMLNLMVPWCLTQLVDSQKDALANPVSSLSDIAELFTSESVIRYCINNAGLTWCKSILQWGKDMEDVKIMVCQSIGVPNRADGTNILNGTTCDVTAEDVETMKTTCDDWLGNWNTCEKWLALSTPSATTLKLSENLQNVKRAALYRDMFSTKTDDTFDPRWKEFAREISTGTGLFDGPAMIILPEIDSMCKANPSTLKCQSLYEAAGSQVNHMRVVRKTCEGNLSSNLSECAEVWEPSNALMYGDFLSSSCAAAYNDIASASASGSTPSKKMGDLVEACDRYYNDLTNTAEPEVGEDFLIDAPTSNTSTLIGDINAPTVGLTQDHHSLLALLFALILCVVCIHILWRYVSKKHARLSGMRVMSSTTHR